MEAQRAAEIIKRRTIAEQDVDRAVAHDAAQTAIENELAGIITRDEQKMIDLVRAVRAEQIAQARDKLAYWQKIDAQSDDVACKTCCDRMRALGVILQDQVLEMTDARMALVNEIDAKTISDAAKKRLIDIRWK